MYRLGIDLGGTNIVAGIVDENYNIVFKKSVKTNVGRSAAEIVNSIANLMFDTIDGAGISLSEIVSFGIGSPGVVDSVNGIIKRAGNLGFNELNLTYFLKKATEKDFYIENDANAATYGEFIAGAGVGTKNFIVITLGTGIGSGIIINDKLFAGCEIGHITIDINGEICSDCGNIGCFENYASATALISQTKKAMLLEKNTIMWDIAKTLDNVSGRTVFDAAKMGDQTALKLIDKYVGYLSAGIMTAIRMFEPQKICIGGGISNEKDYLIRPIIEYINKHNKSGNLLKTTEISIAKLQNDAGIIGAAFLDKLK